MLVLLLPKLLYKSKKEMLPFHPQLPPCLSYKKSMQKLLERFKVCNFLYSPYHRLSVHIISGRTTAFKGRYPLSNH